MSTLLAEVVPTRAVVDRPSVTPQAFADAGIHILRTPKGEGPEIWCRCDGGPHGFLSIAAHGHADALSVEVRHDGVELLVDPGTYCYHGQPEWRSYFRSTRAHNTVEVDGEDQVHEAGPFMWTGHADAVVDGYDADPAGRQKWTAHHTSYSRLDAALRHAREVSSTARERGSPSPTRSPAAECTGSGCSGISVPRSRPSSWAASSPT
jgi:hypothetical protein